MTYLRSKFPKGREKYIFLSLEEIILKISMLLMCIKGVAISLLTFGRMNKISEVFINVDQETNHYLSTGNTSEPGLLEEGR